MLIHVHLKLQVHPYIHDIYKIDQRMKIEDWRKKNVEGKIKLFFTIVKWFIAQKRCIVELQNIIELCRKFAFEKCRISDEFFKLISFMTQNLTTCSFNSIKLPSTKSSNSHTDRNSLILKINKNTYWRL